MKVGELVYIVQSPYSDVPKGSKGVLQEIRKDHFGKDEHLYVVSGLNHKNFREYEISATPPRSEKGMRE